MSEFEPVDEASEALHAAALAADGASHRREGSVPTQIRRLRRSDFLGRVDPVHDGPVLAPARVRPVSPGRARAAANAGAAVRGFLAVGGPAAGVAAKLGTQSPDSIAIAAVPALLVVIWPRLYDERGKLSALHGAGYQYLSVKTWTGPRSLNLGRLILCDPREDGSGMTAMDSEGVVVRLLSGYGKRALSQAAERWGVGRVAPTSAASKRLAWISWSRRNAMGRALLSIPAKALYLIVVVAVTAAIR